MVVEAFPAIVASHDAPQRRIRFKGRRVHADGLALHEAGSTQAVQHPGKDGAMRFEIDDASAKSSSDRAARCPVRHQESRARQTSPPHAMRCPAPSRCPRSSQSTAAGNRCPAAGLVDHGVGVERRTLTLGEVVEPMLAQQLIQSRVERVTRRRHQLRRRHPHRRLPHAFAFSHCHARSVVRKDRVAGMCDETNLDRARRVSVYVGAYPGRPKWSRGKAD